MASEIRASCLWFLSSLPFVSGVLDNREKFGGCDICFKSKQTRGVFSESINKASVAFELIHVDLWGPYREPSSCGAVYFLTIVDDFSRAVWIHLLLGSRRSKWFYPTFVPWRKDNLDAQFKRFEVIMEQSLCVFQSTSQPMESFIRCLACPLHNRMVGLNTNINTYLTCRDF